MSVRAREGEPGALEWGDLPETLREALGHKLEGLYGGGSSNNAAPIFDSLAVDKQQALLIFVRRLCDLGLWDTVRRIENVYGTGGVGMNFSAWPYLASTLGGRRDFTTWFATHGDTTRGFIEVGTGRRPSLHLLYAEKGEARKWEAHFDLYNPWASPLSAWRHLLYEKFHGQTPDWRSVGVSLGYL